ncbi:MAG: DUF2461 domain-containing protein [Deltaproteobacteria bacterium]|nr:DUF2461 domain-containing protein [Deltaproteobacteria bacterium]
MISKQTFQFLRDLKKNNNRNWFNNNKEKYQAAAAEFEDFVNVVIPDIARFDKSIAGVSARDCIFRIYRDVRFSKDKSPYKTHFGAWIVKSGRKSHDEAGYYIHIEPDGSILAGGAHNPPSDWLMAIRGKIHSNGKEFKKIIGNAIFKKYFREIEGEKLSRPPQGFDVGHPDIELLKQKSYLAVHKVKDNVVMSGDFAKLCAEVFKALYPFDKFLNQAIP